MTKFKRFENLVFVFWLKAKNFLSIKKRMKWKKAVAKYSDRIEQFERQNPGRQIPLVWSEQLQDYRWLGREERKAKLNYIRKSMGAKA